MIMSEVKYVTMSQNSASELAVSHILIKTVLMVRWNPYRNVANCTEEEE